MDLLRDKIVEKLDKMVLDSKGVSKQQKLSFQEIEILKNDLNEIIANYNGKYSWSIFPPDVRKLIVLNTLSTIKTQRGIVGIAIVCREWYKIARLHSFIVFKKLNQTSELARYTTLVLLCNVLSNTICCGYAIAVDRRDSSGSDYHFYISDGFKFSKTSKEVINLWFLLRAGNKGVDHEFSKDFQNYRNSCFSNALEAEFFFCNHNSVVTARKDIPIYFVLGEHFVVIPSNYDTNEGILGISTKEYGEEERKKMIYQVRNSKLGYLFTYGDNYVNLSIKHFIDRIQEDPSTLEFVFEEIFKSMGFMLWEYTLQHVGAISNDY